MRIITLSDLVWKERYSVGVQVLDGQHKRLIELITKLQDAMWEGRGREGVRQTLDELIQYTRLHFAAEERLLSHYDYPEFAEHKAAHDHLADKVSEFQRRFVVGQAALSVQLMQFLKDWLLRHLLGDDQKYALFLAAKGVK